MENYNEFGWVNGELVQGETVLWRGKPGNKIYLTSQDSFLIPLSIFWFGFTVFWEYTAITSTLPGFFPLLGIPFLCLGMYLLFGRFIHQKHILKNSCYVITDTRAIFYRKGNVASCDYRHEATISLKLNKDGSGTITFGNPDTTTYNRRGYMQLNNIYANATQFINIPDVENVYRIINQQKAINK